MSTCGSRPPGCHKCCLQNQRKAPASEQVLQLAPHSHCTLQLTLPSEAPWQRRRRQPACRLPKSLRGCLSSWRRCETCSKPERHSPISTALWQLAPASSRCLFILLNMHREAVKTLRSCLRDFPEVQLATCAARPSSALAPRRGSFTRTRKTSSTGFKEASPTSSSLMVGLLHLLEVLCKGCERRGVMRPKRVATRV